MMSWSQPMYREDTQDQMSVLVGSAIQLLRGEAGVFVVSNEAFDPQSNHEYTYYCLNSAAASLLLHFTQGGMQPNSLHPFVSEALDPQFMAELGIAHEFIHRYGMEVCSLALYDELGSLGTMHFLRPLSLRSCFEHGDESEGTLRLFIQQFATSLRFAFKSQSLVKEQARLAAIFRYSSDGILTVDSALRIIDFNPAMEQLTGWREEEVLGQFYVKVLRPQDRQGKDLGLQDSPILQAFIGNEVVNREMIICARDGQQFAVSVTASCVRSARDEPMNGILNVHDLTREREQEEQRSTFISVISHELQTPIAIIKGYASTLARADASFDQQVLHTRLVAIEEEADRLNALVGNLLYASRIQANGLQMDIAPLDLEHLVRVMVRRLHAKNPAIHVTTSFPPHLPTVMADRERIEEVIQNLLDNAVKYSSGHTDIAVACYMTGEEVIVSISDHGMGISLREQQHIFERFKRVGEPLSQSTPGAGLGLYICRAIVEAHGGRIWVESTLRQGSTFSFSLPREEKAQLPMVVF